MTKLPPSKATVVPAVTVLPFTVKLTTDKVLSISLSLLRTLPVATESSATVLISLTKTDGSSTGVILMVKVAVAPVLVV